jgi:acetyltransferase-like isoleucine patch superfamily enzyme
MSNPPAARLLSFTRRLGSWWRVTLARASGAQLDRGCVLGPGADLQLGLALLRRGQISLGENCELGQSVVLHPCGGSITLDRDIFIGPGSVIYGHGGVIIGKDTLVSMHCRILSSNHTIPPPGTIIRSQPDRPLPTLIGRDVWLGAGVTVLGGVTIGDGCVVGAGAVVTKNLLPGSIAVGVPARVVGARF